MSFYISIDPGNKKCGLLLANIESGKVIKAGIASKNKFSNLVTFWSKHYVISKIIIGDGTNCQYVKNELNRKNFFDLKFVNEKGSTLRARFRYWEIWPPNYFIRWIPKEALFPPDNLDAVVALILLEDFLNSSLIWPKKVDIKIWI
tara:strand:- start:23 stop:460 length:438 start_codon:yes stop_codon:yes gene_type:complete